LEPIVTFTSDTPGNPATSLRAWLWISAFASAGWVVKASVNETCPP
jgi:hypothetical protein